MEKLVHFGFHTHKHDPKSQNSLARQNSGSCHPPILNLPGLRNIALDNVIAKQQQQK